MECHSYLSSQLFFCIPPFNPEEKMNPNDYIIIYIIYYIYNEISLQVVFRCLLEVHSAKNKL